MIKNRIIDARGFQRQIKRVAGLFAELDDAKTQKQQHSEGGGSKAFGPRDPGNAWAIGLSIELTENLFEVVRDAANHITPTRILSKDPIELCDWLVFNADGVLRLEFAHDLKVEINNIDKRLTGALHPEDLEAQRKEEKWESSESIIVKLRRRGHHVTRDNLHTWAKRGHIQRRKDGPRNTYRMGDVLAHLSGDSTRLGN
ncbi:hypothetical protein [Corynebacterium durum]|uniref:hypothetical protein n=1 Tax=Corynebacterium durum TaxID=61592 RepID=UPI0026DD9260|nr:hypothetical protein [Corynebacterium durum]MDO4653386.1 hypothetical protein [Corynebacterium durum]